MLPPLKEHGHADLPHRTTHQAAFAKTFIAPQANQVLSIVAGLPGREADLLRDGSYCMTLRLGENGLWSIFEREGHVVAAELQMAG